MTGPDGAHALAKYRRLADRYDRRTAPLGVLRRRAVERLALQPGDVVADVACGTGANFSLIQDRIGQGGRLIGIELSPEMLARAQRRVDEAGWTNVTLIGAGIEQAALAAAPNAYLFSFTHDVLQLPDGLTNLFAQASPAARVASVGTKYVGRARFVTDPVVRGMSRPFITTFDGLDRPWHHLERFTADLRVRPVFAGGCYLAWGTLATQA